MADHPNDWWRGAVGYQIYLRSFADGDGDGVGDLIGVAGRLDHLANLGVDIVWITPCYPSPGADHGYDVSDYLEVDDLFGGRPALDAVVDGAHARGMRVILDLVPNHSSDQHPWFQQALADPSSPARDFYVWRDPAPDGGPPNNWRSHFGGPAWTLDPASGQYWLHLFLPEQPDLNWRNPAVREAFADILRTWFERGLDGFRIDVAHALVVDEAFRSNPEPDVPVDEANPRAAFDAIQHLHDLDQPEAPSLYAPLRAIADEFDAFLVGEVYLFTGEGVARYVEDGLLHHAFFFPALHTAWDPEAIGRVLHDGVAHGRGRFSWPLSSHDDDRAATRFGGGADGTERALAYFAFLSALPGIPFLYQGDELGLENGQVPATASADPITVRNDGAPGRDGSRTPIPWEPGHEFGFTTGTPWLGLGPNRSDTDTAAAQARDDRSPLERTRRLLATRRELRDVLASDDATWLAAPPHVLAIRRGDVVAAMNIGGPPATVDLGQPGTVVHTTDADGAGHTVGTTLHVPTDRTVLVRLG